MENKINKQVFILSAILAVLLIYIISDRIFFTHKVNSYLSRVSLNNIAAVNFASTTSNKTATSTIATSTATTTRQSILPPEAPINYTDNKNGTITDNYTGLVWKKCVQGFSGNDCKTGSPSYRDWGKSRAECDNLVFAGKSDWRLPTLKELESIVDSSVYSPAINKNFFVKTPDGPYWTATSPASFSGSKFIVIFAEGSVYFNDANNFAATRCVR